MTRAPRLCVLGLVLAALSGCSDIGVETTYGRMRGASVNGTGALAELFRAEGHQVRSAVRLTDNVGRWAETIVRFAPYPGEPDHEEADWYAEWLNDEPGRRLIYVVRDFDAEPEYWAAALARLPKDADAKRKQRMEQRLEQTRDWTRQLPPPAKDRAPSREWFGFKNEKNSPVVCKGLGGRWASDVDVSAAAMTRHRALRADPGDRVLLTGDGEPLVIDLGAEDDDVSNVLIVANASFLLNEPLAHRARRPLAMRVVRWGGADGPRNVVFVESRSPAAQGAESEKSIFSLLWIEPFGWIAAHLGVFGLIGCLAAAVRLGRPRPEPPAGADRPAAHAEALGSLLARTRDADAAKSALDAYRRWRHATTGKASARGGRIV